MESPDCRRVPGDWAIL